MIDERLGDKGQQGVQCVGNGDGGKAPSIVFVSLARGWRSRQTGRFTAELIAHNSSQLC